LFDGVGQLRHAVQQGGPRVRVQAGQGGGEIVRPQHRVRGDALPTGVGQCDGQAALVARVAFPLDETAGGQALETVRHQEIADNMERSLVKLAEVTFP
jgi:hypothetical protein